VRYATELLSSDTRSVGYLLKDRIADIDEFIEAARRVAAGGTALEHVAAIFMKLDLAPGNEQHGRRVMAVVQYLNS
jgi:DNA-binding NarL/FixJ family response regulator